MPTVSQFLIERLSNAGISHLFGVPGEYISGFFQQLSRSTLTLVTTSNEEGAAFAADAYARVRGLGCVGVTYNVGALKTLNAVACAAVERSPLVVISGAPPLKDKAEAHHAIGQETLFAKLCCATAVLDDPSQAGFEIDRVLEAAKFYKQPVYIELPQDVADKSIAYDVYRHGTPQAPKSIAENLNEAIEEATHWINISERPVILAGVEIARFELGVQLQKFAEKANIPVATTMLSKSVIAERHPMYLGLYNGQYSQPGVQEAVEQSDCLLMFGVISTDTALSHMPEEFRKKNVVSVTVEEIKIKRHAYKSIQLPDFMDAFFKASVHRKEKAVKSLLPKEKAVFSVKREARITSERVFEKINSILDANSVIVSDIGNCLYGSSQLMVHHNHAFIGHALYTTMGAAIPGALGINMARLHSRPIVLVGDGAFQMSMNEIGTLVANKLKPMIFVLNNHGYATEKLLIRGHFNNIPDWKYHKVAEMVGGIGLEIYTEGDLENAIVAALESDQLHIININLDADDNCALLKTMSKAKTNE